MIQMRMSQKDSVYAPRLDRERLPVPLTKLPFLEKSAINKKFGAIGVKEMARTRDILGGAKKLQFHRHIVPHYVTFYGDIRVHKLYKNIVATSSKEQLKSS